MKLVFTRNEIAEALAKSPAEFDHLRPALEGWAFQNLWKGWAIAGRSWPSSAG